METDSSLDGEYTKYLRIMRPFLQRLRDDAVIDLCDAWLKKLEDYPEKHLRNDYALALCYQLSLGKLSHPFNKLPTTTLPSCPDTSDMSSDCDSQGEAPKVLFKNQSIQSGTYDDQTYSKDDWTIFQKSSDHDDSGGSEPLNPTVFSYVCSVKGDSSFDFTDKNIERANKLIIKLRDIKQQNRLLNEELNACKADTRDEKEYGLDFIHKVDISTSANLDNSLISQKSLQEKLSDMEESRKVLLGTINNLQDELKHLEESKHKEILDLKSQIEAERKERRIAEDKSAELLRDKINELTENYEEKFRDMNVKKDNAIKNIIINHKGEIEEKEKEIEAKDKEIKELQNELHETKSNIQSLIKKILDKSSDTTENIDIYKIKIKQLEKQLSKAEKYNCRCAKNYESRISMMQRDHHLSEASMQLELVRNRTQVINETVSENQNELSNSLDKLERKYKEIIANIQSTSIQRRMQDQMCVETLLRATFGDESVKSPFSSNSTRAEGTRNDPLHGEDDEGLPSKDTLREFFNKLYIPQRDK